MKKILLYNSICNVSMFVFTFIIKTFCCWEIENPFKFFIDMPNYSVNKRIVIFVVFTLYQFYQIVIIVVILNRLKNEKPY